MSATTAATSALCRWSWKKGSVHGGRRRRRWSGRVGRKRKRERERSGRGGNLEFQASCVSRVESLSLPPSPSLPLLLLSLPLLPLPLSPLPSSQEQFHHDEREIIQEELEQARHDLTVSASCSLSPLNHMPYSLVSFHPILCGVDMF